MGVIDLPPWAIPNGATASLLDWGGVLRPSTGAALLRVDRLGSRYKVAFSFPPFDDPAQARVIVSRLIRAKRMGLRAPFPLVTAQPLQDCVVDQAGQSGTTLKVRGLFRGSVVREGFWLSIVRADGQRFLHNVGGQVMVGEDGRAALPLSEMLRWPFADGDKVEFVRPMIEGLVDGNEQAWAMSLERWVNIEFTIEEAA
jgi:hypothetical protein